MTICVIPARGGSVRIPRKNLKVFCGKPIIQYSIEAALGAGFDTIVSTDDQAIASFAESCGADIYFRHWDDPAGDVGTQEITTRVLERIGVKAANEDVVTLYATAPAVTKGILLDALHDFRELSPAGVNWVVGSYPYRMEDCGAFYIGGGHSYLYRYPLVVAGTVAFPVPDHIDINTQADWDKYEEMYREQAK